MRAPILVRPWMLERATLLWVISPTMATFSPSSEPNFWRMVSMSRSPWEGCS